MYIGILTLENMACFPYDVGGLKPCPSRRITEYDYLYSDYLYFYTSYCFVLFYVSCTGKHTLFTQNKR